MTFDEVLAKSNKIDLAKLGESETLKAVAYNAKQWIRLASAVIADTLDKETRQNAVDVRVEAELVLHCAMQALSDPSMVYIECTRKHYTRLKEEASCLIGDFLPERLVSVKNCF